MNTFMKFGGHLFIFLFLVFSNTFLLINRNKEDWPIADNIVTHSVRPFDAYNHVWRIFADSEADFVNMLYSKDSAHKSTWGNNRGLLDIEMLQYSVGCYPELLLKTDSNDVTFEHKSDKGDEGSVKTAANAAATTIELTTTMSRLVANNDYVIIKDEIMKVTGIDTTAHTITVQRATAPAGFKSVAASNLNVNDEVHRLAPVEAIAYPYELRSLQGTDNPATNRHVPGTKLASDGLTDGARKSFKNKPMSLCKCLADVDTILRYHNSAADATTWRNDNIIAANTATRAGNAGNPDSVSQGVHHDNLEKNAADRFKMDLADDHQSAFKIRAVDSCVANYVGEYTQSYDGVLDARHLVDFGQALLTLGVITIMLSSVYVVKSDQIMTVDDLFHPGEEPVRISSIDSMYVLVGHLLVFGFGVAAFVLNIVVDPHRTACTGDDSKCNTEKELLNNRENSLSWPDPLTISNVYHATTGIVFLVVALAALARLVGVFYAQQNMQTRWIKVIDNKVSRRIFIDLPFITGYAAMGMGLLAQSGVQDTISLLFAFVTLFVIGLFQHISNVSKLMYDALCRHTSPETMQKLFENSNDPSQKTHVKSTLQFFGWSRLFVFITMLLGSLSYLTMTREVIESSVVQAFMNGQLFYFILAFFWSNVGYDIVREMVPFQFEKMHMDSSKLFVTLGYLSYFNINMFWLHSAAWHSGEFNFALHEGYSM